MLEAFSEPSEASKINFIFAKIVNGFQPLIIFAKKSILYIWLGSESTSGFIWGTAPAQELIEKLHLVAYIQWHSEKQLFSKYEKIYQKIHVLESFLKVSGWSVKNKKRFYQELFPRIFQQVLRVVVLKKNSKQLLPSEKLKIDYVFRLSLNLRILLILLLLGTIIRTYYSSMMVATIRNFLKLQPMSKIKHH